MWGIAKGKVDENITFPSLNITNEERALSFIHQFLWEGDNHLIMGDPLFSQPLSTNVLLLQDMIPLNPPHVSHNSKIRYANQISMIFSLEYSFNNHLLEMVEEIFEKSFLGINPSHIPTHCKSHPCLRY